MSDDPFTPIALAVAKAFWGEPAQLTKREARWGANGAKSMNLDKGAWTDWTTTGSDGNADGGGVIDLVMRETGSDKAGALKWLTQEGYLDERREVSRDREVQREEPPIEDMTIDGAPNETDDGRKVEYEAYTYVNRDGEAIYQVVRFLWQRADGSWVLDPKTGTPKKTFAQRRKVNGEIVWNLEGIEHTIYRHNLIEQAIADGKTIYLPEGEKDVRTLEAWGLVASTNSGGAKNWTDALAVHFKGADVVVLIDNDEAGRSRGQKVARSLKGIASRIRLMGFDGPEKGDVTDWKDSGGTCEQLLAMVGKLPEWMPAPPTSKFGAQQFENIGKNGIAYDWLIKGIIARGEVFIVAGEMQTGKSFFTIDMGMKVAQGADYCHRQVKQGLVIYVACEDARGVELRAEGYRREHGLENKAIPFVVMTRKLSLMEDKGIEEFIAECLEWEDYYGLNLELIYIDTFSVATEGLDEIQSGEVGKVLGRVNRIAEATGAAIGLVHHLNAEGKRVRGHSSLTANVSQVIEIRPLQKPQPNRNLPIEYIKDSDGRLIRRARLVKNKNGPNTEGWQFVIRQIKLGDDADGYPITTCVLDVPSGGAKEEGQGTRLSQDQRLVLNALQSALEDNGIEMPAGVRVGTQIRKAVANKDWMAHVGKVWTFKAPDTEPEKRATELRDVMIRTGKALLNAGYIGRDNDKKIVWSLGKDDRPRKVEPAAEPARPTRSPHMAPDDDKVPF